MTFESWKNFLWKSWMSLFKTKSEEGSFSWTIETKKTWMTCSRSSQMWKKFSACERKIILFFSDLEKKWKILGRVMLLDNPIVFDPSKIWVHFIFTISQSWTSISTEILKRWIVFKVLWLSENWEKGIKISERGILKNN